MVMPVNHILGLTLNSRLLTVGVPPYFLAKVITILQTTWGKHRFAFIVNNAEILTSKLNHIAYGAPWLKFLLGHIYSSLAYALQFNQAHLIRTSHAFRCALKVVQTAPPSPDGNKQCAFHAGLTARSIHHNKYWHFIDCNTARDLRMIKRALVTDTIIKACPIAHLIPRMPTGIA